MARMTRRGAIKTAGAIVCSACMPMLGGAAEKCPTCNGNGKCNQCSNGSVRCNRCNGTGRVDGKQCPVCSGQGNQKCTTCQGGGRCSKCNGTGKI
jgi:hypothetical protein